MYNLETLKRLIEKYGIIEIINWLSSDNFPAEIKIILKEFNVFNSCGTLNVELIKALV